MNTLKPSNFTSTPFDSVLKKSEAETVARNVMVILKRTGDEFRLLSWEEYRQERMKDGSFTESEKTYFEQVAGFCTTAAAAQAFCAGWARED